MVVYEAYVVVNKSDSYQCISGSLLSFSADKSDDICSIYDYMFDYASMASNFTIAIYIPDCVSVFARDIYSVVFVDEYAFSTFQISALRHILHNLFLHHRSEFLR